MFDLEHAIAEWRRTFRKIPSLEDGVLAELETHLREEIGRRVVSGSSEEAAFAAATAVVGRPEDVGAEYFKESARSFVSAPDWSGPRFSPVLLISHLKIALRKIKMRKGLTLLNVLGLAAGMAACLLILLWVRDELSYDRFHRDVASLYRLVLIDQRAEGTSYLTELPSPAGPALAEGYREVEAVVRTYGGRFQVRFGEKAFNEDAVCFVDPGFFRMFSFPAVAGDPAAGLADPSSIVLTEATAKRYFGTGDPLGKTLTFDGKRDYTVAAVVRVPPNTGFAYDLFPSLRALEHWGVSAETLASNWRGRMYRTYAKVRQGADLAGLELKSAGLMKAHNPLRNERIRFQPLTKMRLFAPDGTPAGMRIVVILSIIAALILVIACANFTSLATARAGTRAVEISLRKTVGARRSQLARQILGETLFLSALAMGLSLILVSLSLPSFNRLTGKALALGLDRPATWFSPLILAFFAGGLAGLYPALLLSSFKPAVVLKGRATSSRRGAGLRKVLLLFQFTVSILLLIATAVILSQIRYIQTRDIGFDRSQLVYAYLTGDNRDRAEALKQELARRPEFLEMTACNNLPAQILYQYSADWVGRDPGAETEFNYTVCDFDYIRTFRMTILEGRDFSPGRPADEDAFLVNEEAARRIGRTSVLGTRLKFMDGHWGEIIGVVKNFNFRGVGTSIRPLVLTPRGRKSFFVARMKPGDPARAVRLFSEAWNRVNPDFVFNYGFVDQVFDRLYANESQLVRIVGAFSLLAVLVSCLGMIGLAAFTVEHKTKEIGIRKVLGAGAAEIVRMISTDFLRWVVLANLIAWPAAAWIMDRWLANYAYRTKLAGWMFALAGVASIVCALATISIHVVRAARANPVESLRLE